MISTNHSAFDALAKFRQQLEAYTRKAVCGREYVLTERLKRDHLQESDIGKLLAEIYRGSPGYPVTPATIYRHSRVVFLILLASGLRDGLGRVIAHFQSQNINDGTLPIDPQDLRRRISVEGVAEETVQKIVDQFCETQWRFCAYTFGERESSTLRAEHILPICNKKDINQKGGTAELSEIVVLEDFVGESLRKAVSGSAFIPTEDKDRHNDGKRYVFALKTFAGSKHGIWQCETEAFNGLRDHEGIVKCLGYYKHLNGNAPTYNILLEFGELDLEDYFYQNEPPSLQQELEEFWESLFAVAKALDGLHNFTSPHALETYKGWHADIKPANILSIHGAFKLADPGFAKFEQVRDGSQPQKTHLTGGTWTYGAPERLRNRRRVSVTQAIDIWSLGCVFSEAVTWVVGGQPLIKAFIDVRKGAVKITSVTNGEVRDAQSADCFHEGKQVPEGLIDWHKMLRHSIRKNDYMTEKVLDLVETKMLLADPSQRISAQQLTRELETIKEDAQKQPRCPIPDNIMTALLQADEGGSHEAYRSIDRQQMLAPAADLNRLERKSLLRNAPHKKTAQRAEYLKSALSSSSETIKGEPRSSIDSAIRPGDETAVDDGPAQEPPPQPIFPFTPIRSSQSIPERHAQSTHRQSDLSSLRVSLSLNSMHQADRVDVFKAREALDRKNLSTVIKKSLGMDLKDGKLSRHFKERDIVFLVDNAYTMLPYWSQAKFLLKTLVEMSTGQDEDGMDLSFTSGTEELRGCDKAKRFDETMSKESAMPTKESLLGTDMADSLGRIFDKHLERLEGGRSAKLLTVIVFTDGLWTGMKDRLDIKERIANFIRAVKEKGTDLRTRPVSIQFVQFGRDFGATLLLRSLDDDMEAEYNIDDVIDLEPADGDVYKMILGSFVFEMDRRETNVLSPTLSPEQTFSDQSITQSPPQVSSPETEKPPPPLGRRI